MAIVNLYIANLSAALMIETTVKPIKSAEDLANLNGRIKYGAKKNGSTFNFFKVSLNMARIRAQYFFIIFLNSQ